jgi:glycosyltransferase involved in cell wall biosynthesis
MYHFDFVNHTQRKCDFDDEILELGGHLYHLPKFRLWRFFSFIKAWDDFLTQHDDYDVVHIHYFTLAGLILPIAKKHGIKIRIAHSHITKKSSKFKTILFSILRKKLVKNSTMLLACSEEAGINMFKTKNFIVFNNAIDSDSFCFNQKVREDVRKEFHYSDDDIVIGNVGSFRSEQKNHRFIVDLFAKLVKKDNRFKLLLVGEGDLRPIIEKKVRDLSITDSVIFTGVRSDVPRLFQGMDIFFFPSLFEGLGIVAIEAQTAGVPTVLSTEIPKEAYISDLVKAVNLNDNDQKWIDAIIYSSKREISRLSYKDVAYKNNFDVKKNISVLEAIYSGKYHS